MEEDKNFLEFCHKIHLDPKISQKLKMFAKLKYLDNQGPEAIAKSLSVSVKELDSLEAALLRYHQEAVSAMH